MKKLDYIGTPSGGQGYSGSIELTIIALNKIIDVYSVALNRTPKKNISAPMKKIKTKPFVLTDVGIYHGFPLILSGTFNKFNVIYTMFETDTLPSGKDWAGEYGDAIKIINEKADLLFVPCKHNVELFKNSGVTVPIEIIPNGVQTDLYPYYDRSKRPKDHKFTFFMHGTLTLRKNPGMVISAFANLFKDNPDVKLVLKTQSGTLGHMQFVDMGNIEVIDALWTQEQLNKAMQDADCYVFPSRGEGFGLPPLEAMSTGLPTIVSDNTGLSDYAKEPYCLPIPTIKKSPAQRYPKPWGYVGNWYEPDYYTLKKHMLWVYEHQDEAREMGELASEYVQNNWTYDHTAEKIVKAIRKHYSGW